MSEAQQIEEDVLAFLYRIRCKERNTPTMQKEASALAVRIVGLTDSAFGFIELRELRRVAKDAENRSKVYPRLLKGLERELSKCAMRLDDSAKSVTNLNALRLKLEHEKHELGVSLANANLNLRAIRANEVVLHNEIERMAAQLREYRERFDPKERKKVPPGRKLVLTKEKPAPA